MELKISLLKKIAKDYNDIKNYKTLEMIYTKYNINANEFANIKKQILKNDIELIGRYNKNKEQTTNNKIKQNTTTKINTLEENVEISKLKTQLRKVELEKKEILDEYEKKSKLFNLLNDIDKAEIKKQDYPSFLQKETIKSDSTIPTLFLSDLHFDEIVYPEQINYINQYNREIAIKRLNYMVDSSINILTKHMKLNYDGFVFALGGDLLSGNIHEELRENNEAPILDSILVLTDLLIHQIEKLKKVFKKVFVPCVVGNHGRLDKKPRMKNKVIDNFEYILCKSIERHFSKDKDVSVIVSPSSDLNFEIYNTKFLLTHGDQFKGGNGIAGVFSPIMRGDAQKRKRNNAIQNNYDVLMIGHFHQLITTKNIIMNGSVKGYDEYSFNSNFSFENPQQALFLTHPKFGINYILNIQCNGYEIKDNKTKNKISVF